MNRKVITVDGLAGTGKTTIAKLLAKKLGFKHLNSGLLYRALGYLAVNNKVQLSNEIALSALLSSHKILYPEDESFEGLLIDNIKIRNDELMTSEISQASSVASQYMVVRNMLIDLQREAYPGENIVAEGRDMGTIIFPEATLKFFLVVNIDTKVKRRLDQLISFGLVTGDLWEAENQIKIDILERDNRDSTRVISPTIPATEAIILDNSSVSLTQIVQSMYDAAALRGMTEAG